MYRAKLFTSVNVFDILRICEEVETSAAPSNGLEAVPEPEHDQMLKLRP